MSNSRLGIPQPPPHLPTRVAVVGAGNVGSTFAYTLVLSGLASEIVLVDANHARAEGEAMDLNHSVPFSHPTRVWAGDFSDCAGAAITVIAAGTGQRSGESRLDLLQRNGAVFEAIVPKISAANPDGILVIATNPVDVLTYAAWKYSGLPNRKVIGSGTILDTARFRHLLSRYFGVGASGLHAYIIGEHGDSQVPVWSLANIAGMPLPAFCAAQGLAYDEAAMEQIARETRNAANEIISRKGATYYAVAAGLVQIVESILRDESTVLPVSTLVEDYREISGVYLSLPALIDRSGVKRVLKLELSAHEADRLRASAEILRASTDELGLSDLRKGR